MKSIDQVAFCLARTYSIQKSAILDLIQVIFFLKFKTEFMKNNINLYVSK
jgi:hypothetical protein